MTTFRVYGLPAPQGSKTRMPSGAMVEGSSSSGRARLRDWRSACAVAAAQAAPENLPYDGPCVVQVVFRFPMPKSRPAAVRSRGSAWKASKPDLDKLCRALGDSLVAGGLIARDELIVRWVAAKVEVADGWTGAQVTVHPAPAVDATC